MDMNDPLAAMLAARNINPPDGTPEMQTPEPDPQGELEDLEPEKVTRKRRAMRLPDVFDDEGVAVLVSRASKPELVAFATENKILVEPPEGRSKPGIREYRAAVEAFVAFTEDEPEEVAEPEQVVEPIVETWTETPVVEPVVETPAPLIEPDEATIELTEKGREYRAREKRGRVSRQVFDSVTRPPAQVIEPDERFEVDQMVLLTVYINCTPRGPVTYLEELLAPIAREVEKESGAPHYLAIPYNNGPKRVAGVFAHQIRSGLVDVTGAIVADLRLPASEAAVEVLLQYADEVVRRF